MISKSVAEIQKLCQEIYDKESELQREHANKLDRLYQLFSLLEAKTEEEQSIHKEIQEILEK